MADPNTLLLPVDTRMVLPNGNVNPVWWSYFQQLQTGLTTIDLTSQVTGVLPGANGGTNHANTSKTITIGGNLTGSGAHDATFVFTGTTNVTFPTSGTLLTSATVVSSITGTANQITASAATGAVTLSIPSLLSVTWINYAGQSRVATQFDKTNATLANVTGLTSTLVSGRTYGFIATLYVTADAVGGQKYAIAGTATATAITYDTIVTDFTGLALVKASRSTALASAVTLAGNANTVFETIIRGTITVNAGGTLTVQFAQDSASGTSSVLVGSTFIVQDIA